jgi:hypothetical protein
MPHVTISIGDLKRARQAERSRKDDVYWVANLHCATAVDPKYTDLTRLFFDGGYCTSHPEMVAIGPGETGRFEKKVVYDADCPTNAYLFGTIHFLERDTPLANYFAKVVEILGIVFGGLAIAAVIGFLIGFGFDGLRGAILGALLAMAFVGLVGFFVGAALELLRPSGGDAHLGGMRIVVGPLAPPPPNSDRDAWQLIMTPSGKLEVVDAHGAELIMYDSSHAGASTTAGHRYETTLQLEITGGHR